MVLAGGFTDPDKLIVPLQAAAAIARILTHLGLAARPPPRAPAVRVDLYQAA